MKRNKEETKETVKKLIEVARKNFTEIGYANASLEVIAAEAELTRGAVYHHFKSKKKLFQLVLESIQKEVGDQVEQAASASEQAWEQLILGCRAFVSSAVEPQRKRILLIDGPSVLGWETWRIMDEENSMRHLREQLQLMQQQGHLKPLPLHAMTHFLSGALNESALWIAENPDTDKSLEEVMSVISAVIQSLSTQ
ncbi:TetR/AcrR family transcriptional regulator [Paenibacillus herberti]|uniref:TetR family transcriptional regulator n=1 Tax=Paenibacillus herberti TaxID=1619309 RepID=A0A229P1W2_9BACL|nr:TetR/AcrR family transcriptional regulator [Paenibacillus herberti]OXM16276.1 TetR family transcriptional regulator [Paenibacillus herberti]